MRIQCQNVSFLKSGVMRSCIECRIACRFRTRILHLPLCPFAAPLRYFAHPFRPDALCVTWTCPAGVLTHQSFVFYAVARESQTSEGTRRRKMEAVCLGVPAVEVSFAMRLLSVRYTRLVWMRFVLRLKLDLPNVLVPVLAIFGSNYLRLFLRLPWILTFIVILLSYPPSFLVCFGTFSDLLTFLNF
jgi:hypothetical protein